MNRDSSLAKVLGVIAVLGMATAAYLLVIRPNQLRWGATDREVIRAMPGDELVPNPTFLATRAVTIEGTPEEIWPWLVQMGYGRAGFYGYDLIENIGSGSSLRSAETIIPELQQLEVGDKMPISFAATMVIDTIKSNRFLVWADDSSPPSGAFTWALYPVDEDQTRLINRFRFRYHWLEPVIFLDLFTDFADPIAVRKILLGVKDRVEGRAEPVAKQNAEITLWIVAFLQLILAVLLILFRQPWWRAWLVALAAAGVLLFTLYAFASIWIGALLEIIITLGLLESYRSSVGFAFAPLNE